MIGTWSSHTSSFLAWFPALVMVIFGMPMLVAPMKWGRMIGFRLPEHTDLAVYFGRSLGCGLCDRGVAVCSQTWTSLLDRRTRRRDGRHHLRSANSAKKTTPPADIAHSADCANLDRIGRLTTFGFGLIWVK